MNENTLLYRQVHPSWIQQGRVTSQVFKPTPKDDGFLSVYNGEMIEPLGAWEHYNKSLKLPSCGVLAVTVNECETLALPARPDPEPFPEHAVIDFNESTSSEREKKAKTLRHYADKRGWCYRQF